MPSSVFINPDQTVPVTVGDNTMHVKAHLDFATRAAIEESLMRLEMTQFNTNGKAKDSSDKMVISARTTQNGQRLALLEHCIVSWSGPAFLDNRGRPVPVTVANIRRLNPDDELVKAAIETINDLQNPDTELPEEVGAGPDEGEAPN